MSDFEKEEIALRRRKLEVERDLLIERRRTTIGSFDDALAELRAEKLKLEADLKTTDLRKLVLFQERALPEAALRALEPSADRRCHERHPTSPQ